MQCFDFFQVSWDISSTSVNKITKFMTYVGRRQAINCMIPLQIFRLEEYSIREMGLLDSSINES